MKVSYCYHKDGFGKVRDCELLARIFGDEIHAHAIDVVSSRFQNHLLIFFGGWGGPGVVVVFQLAFHGDPVHLIGVVIFGFSCLLPEALVFFLIFSGLFAVS